MDHNLYDILTERDLVAQTTDADIRQRLATPLSAYIGFDPTADSLHVGSMVPIMGLTHLQRCGHQPLVLVGGATGLIGDPSGKTEARKMLTAADIEHNVQHISSQLSHFLRFGDGEADAKMLNNAEWIQDLSWIEVLRELGPHFSVNRMLTMDSVKGRMETGISFLEFNYMVLQAYDFHHLHQTHGCTLQMGGQDQWGNIVMGIELARRKTGAELAGLTLPLVTKSDGSKFGKSEAGNIWLSPELTPVYEFYQFWRNVTDTDVGRFLRFFTLLDMDAIRRLENLEGNRINDAKEVLALAVTSLVHGEQAAVQAQADARKAFSGTQDLSGDSIPHVSLPAAELEAGIGTLALFVRAGLCGSNSDARRLVQGGGARLHDRVLQDVRGTITTADIQDGCLVLRAGKKKYFRFDIV
jgi:tyrosyl-tRNA synthetase